MNSLLIFMVFILPIVYANPTSCKLKPDYDFFQLTLSWPATFCAKNDCKNRIQTSDKLHFNIHGLWPSSYKREEVGYCCNEDYNSQSKTLNEFRKSLEEKWPSMRDDRYDGFWRYEFLKHGSCALDVPKLRGVKNYFGATLRLYDALGLDEQLKLMNVLPSDEATKTYNSNELDTNLTNLYGAKPRIRCLRTNDKEIGILEQISFCYNKDLKLINCQGYLQCSQKFVIPTYKTKLSSTYKF